MESLNFKVKVGEVTEELLKELAEKMKAKIKKFIEEENKKNTSFKFTSIDNLVEKKITTKKYLDFKQVCMNCGDVKEMDSYAIAQIALGNPLFYICECKHKTLLPQ